MCKTRDPSIAGSIRYFIRRYSVIHCGRHPVYIHQRCRFTFLDFLCARQSRNDDVAPTHNSTTAIDWRLAIPSVTCILPPSPPSPLASYCVFLSQYQDRIRPITCQKCTVAQVLIYTPNLRAESLDTAEGQRHTPICDNRFRVNDVTL